MNTLGFVNFSVLARLLWKSADHFLPMQAFYLGAIEEVFLSLHSVGIINGCEVTINAGLTVDIASGLVLFSNGELVTVAAQQVTSVAADPTDPRFDRLEYAYTLENNIVVTDVDLVSKQFDKQHTGTATASVGTPLPSPSPPVKTVGAISIGVVSITAGQTVLIQGDIDPREPSRELSRKVDDTVREENIDNSASGALLVEIAADKTKHRQVWIEYLVQRKTDTALSGVTQSGTISARLNTETGDWQFTDTQEGNGDVQFTVVPATGRITYDSGTIAGANYVGKVKYSSRTIAL